MFRTKTTITRPDRDRLARATQSRVNLLRWGLFVDELSRELKGARVVDPARLPGDTVTMHSTVRIRDSKRGTAELYTLVYPDEADPRSGKLSVLTTVGTALLGRRAGDLVRVASGGGDAVRCIRVEEVVFQPEAASTVAGTRNSLRRARRAELPLVWTLAALVALAMLPAVLAVAAVCGVVALWRRRDQWRRAVARRSANVRPALRPARHAVRILVAAGRAAFQPRARLLADFAPSHPGRGAALPTSRKGVESGRRAPRRGRQPRRRGPRTLRLGCHEDGRGILAAEPLNGRARTRAQSRRPNNACHPEHA